MMRGDVIKRYINWQHQIFSWFWIHCLRLTTDKFVLATFLQRLLRRLQTIDYCKARCWVSDNFAKYKQSSTVDISLFELYFNLNAVQNHSKQKFSSLKSTGLTLKCQKWSHVYHEVKLSQTFLFGKSSPKCQNYLFFWCLHVLSIRNT